MSKVITTNDLGNSIIIRNGKLSAIRSVRMGHIATVGVLVEEDGELVLRDALSLKAPPRSEVITITMKKTPVDYVKPEPDFTYALVSVNFTLGDTGLEYADVILALPSGSVVKPYNGVPKVELDDSTIMLVEGDAEVSQEGESVRVRCRGDGQIEFVVCLNVDFEDFGFGGSIISKDSRHSQLYQQFVDYHLNIVDGDKDSFARLSIPHPLKRYLYKMSKYDGTQSHSGG